MAEPRAAIGLNHDRAAYDHVTQEALTAKFGGEMLPIRRLEGPISSRGDFLMSVIEKVQAVDPSVRVGKVHNGNYDQLMTERPIRIFTTLGSESLMALEDEVLYEDELLEEAS